LARTYRHLDQRRALFRLVEARMPVGEMAARLGHHPSTIYRELAGTASATGTEASAATSP
jgi:IS30 family transposase